MTIPDLKPCPFCGGRPAATVYSSVALTQTYVVYCKDCNAQGQPRSTEAEAVEAWNRRANKEAQEITEYISKKEAVSRISDLLIIQLKGERLPTWNEVYRAIND